MRKIGERGQSIHTSEVIFLKVQKNKLSILVCVSCVENELNDECVSHRLRVRYWNQSCSIFGYGFGVQNLNLLCRFRLRSSKQGFSKYLVLVSNEIHGFRT